MNRPPARLSPRHLAVLVNPAAGGGRAGGIWERLRRATPELGEARLILAGDAEEARQKLDTALDDGVETVVAVGGDGTAHLVVNRILATGRGERVAFGLIPAGTGSDLARSLRLAKRSPAGSCRWLEASPRPLDALEIRTDAGERRFVINIASAGVSGAVDESVHRIAKRGLLTYFRATLSALGSYDPRPCRVVVDGEEIYDGSFFVAAVANGQAFGRGMRVAPRAVLDDGLADVVVVPPFPLWQVPVRTPQFFLGRHLRWPGVLFRRGREIRLEPRGEMPPYDVDGETLPSGPATLRILPRALRVLL